MPIHLIWCAMALCRLCGFKAFFALVAVSHHAIIWRARVILQGSYPFDYCLPLLNMLISDH